MNAWEKRKLGEIFNVVTDYVANGSFKSLRQRVSTYSNPNFAYMIRLQDASNNWKGPWLYTDQQSYSFLAKTKLNPGDILMSNVGSVGKFFLVPDLDRPMTLAPNAILLRSMTYSTYFLFQLLQTSSMTESINEKTTPGVQQKINKTDLKKIITNVPTLNESSMVGQMLSLLDNLIAATQDKIDALEQAKKALLQRLFDQSWRFKGYSDPWEKRKLGETNSYFTDGNYGESYPKESELSDKENGVPFLRGSNLRNGELIEDNANYITKEKHAELTSGHLVEDDIVLAVRGSLGALGYVKDENIDWNINSQLAVIRTDKSELSGKFLVQFLLSWRGQKELLSRNTGTALKQLPIKQLKDVPVPIVNLDEQKEIGALFSSIDNLIAATQSRLSSLELLKKSLLQDLFI
ncbi:restriction endonuclease subunit S [Lacticaseibacillus paracasei]